MIVGPLHEMLRVSYETCIRRSLSICCPLSRVSGGVRETGYMLLPTQQGIRQFTRSQSAPPLPKQFVHSCWPDLHQQDLHPDM